MYSATGSRLVGTLNNLNERVVNTNVMNQNTWFIVFVLLPIRTQA